jgi:hypothetical protein
MVGPPTAPRPGEDKLGKNEEPDPNRRPGERCSSPVFWSSQYPIGLWVWLSETEFAQIQRMSPLIPSAEYLIILRYHKDIFTFRSIPVGLQSGKICFMPGSQYRETGTVNCLLVSPLSSYPKIFEISATCHPELGSGSHLKGKNTRC